MRRPNETVEIDEVVHKNKGSRALNVGMHLLPSLSVGPMVAAKVLYGPLNPATYATLALMFAGTALPAMGTFAEFKETLPGRGKQGVLTLSNTAMISAVALMMMGAIPFAKESDSVKIALSGMVLFGLSSVLNIPYHAARGLNWIGSKLPLELASVISALVGSWLFLAAQVVAYVEAKKSNNQPEMNTAILFGITSLGFICSTGYGAVQIAKAMKECVKDKDAYIPRYTLLPHEFPRVAPSTAVVVVDNDLAQPLIQSPSTPH